MRSNAFRGKYTSPRTSIRPDGAPAPRRRGIARTVRTFDVTTLAADTVASSRGACQHAVFVRQRDADAVDLHLGDVVNLFDSGAS
jgi:hypothetical protein